MLKLEDLRIEDFDPDHSYRVDMVTESANGAVARKIICHVFPLERWHKRIKFELVKEGQSLWYDELEDAIHAWNA